MNFKIDNLLNAKELIIVHQVNCQNKMGSGVAKTIYEKYPEVKSQYHNFCNNSTPSELLGNIQLITTNDKIIVNAFTQLFYGYDKKLYTNYNAIDDAFNHLKSLFPNTNIAIPYLYGCNLGGGDWNIVHNIINNIFQNNVTAYSLKPL